MGKTPQDKTAEMMRRCTLRSQFQHAPLLPLNQNEKNNQSFLVTIHLNPCQANQSTKHNS